ncbi:phage major capsid protein, P2 family [Asticcacaulis endophyticus]|uniref:Phage capsid protein n=1 Tax=Asticcacaulis endophyticus TaxID=1395890 RepID=A0A918UT03_9CAUL|nr:phage major capsid protein, P2 family [Asticcacaulis endophyticus]GGZ32114.1 phage capsid protein [Asticcacaulis endophyticus]
MRNKTRLLYTAFVSHIALINNVASAETKFNVDPTIQQKLLDKQQESVDFLKLINIELVKEQGGQLLGLGVNRRIASRTNTAGGTKRATKSVHSMDGREYLCKKTDFDTHLKYSEVDRWAKFDDFEVRISNHIAHAQGLDRICIGFNGISAAVTTDLVANPMLQDVNIGWLQKLRVEAPAQVLSIAPAGGTKVYYGTHAGNSYKNLDAIVMDAVEELLPSWAADDTGLVAIVGRDLLHDKYLPKVNQPLAPTEENALKLIMAEKRLGGLPAYRAPFFPAGKILITKFSNLSIYEQEDTRRRNIKDNPELDQVDDFQSVNECYVIEDLDFACLIENIEERNAA